MEGQKTSVSYQFPPVTFLNARICTQGFLIFSYHRLLYGCRFAIPNTNVSKKILLTLPKPHEKIPEKFFPKGE